MKTRGIALLSSIPCRELPSHKSQLVTQLLFGETYEVVTKEGEWIQILTDLDQYSCWIPLNQYDEISEHLSFIVNKEENALVFINHKPYSVPLGALVPNFNQTWEINSLKIENRTIKESVFEFSPSEIERITNLLLRAPYLWGGRTIGGIDCSGFSQLIYRMFDKFLPRDAYQQAEVGELVPFLSEVKAGDLAFFDNEEGRITHVGILLNNNTIIHASGFVRIDQVDYQGVYSVKDKVYTHKLRVIKRF